MHLFAILLFFLSLPPQNPQQKPHSNELGKGGQQNAQATQPHVSTLGKIKLGSDVSPSESNEKQSAAETNATPFMTHGEEVISIITLAYVVITYLTLRSIREQGRAVMDADCALLLIQWDNTVHIDPDAPNGQLHHCFHWKLVNRGKTPAFVQNVHSHFIVIKSLDDLPKHPPYTSPREMTYSSEPLAPGQTFPHDIYSPIASPIPFRELDDATRKKTSFLYAFGFAQYLDVYGRLQETRFGLVFDTDETMREDNFRIAGPPAYNRYRQPPPPWYAPIASGAKWLATKIGQMENAQ